MEEEDVDSSSSEDDSINEDEESSSSSSSSSSDEEKEEEENKKSNDTDDDDDVLDEYEVKTFECRWKVLEMRLTEKYGNATKVIVPVANIDCELVGDFLFDLRDRIESLSKSANAWLRKFMAWFDRHPDTTRKSPREKRPPNRLESEAMVIANAAPLVIANAPKKVSPKAPKPSLISQPVAFEITSNSVVEKITGSVKSRAPSQATSGPSQATSAPKVKLPINRRLTEEDLRTWKIDFDAAFKKKNFKDDPNKNR